VETMVVVEEDDMVVEAHVRYAAQSRVSSLLLGSVYLLSSGSKSDNRAEQRRHAILPASLGNIVIGVVAPGVPRSTCCRAKATAHLQPRRTLLFTKPFGFTRRRPS
jgi:hypothetical protein